MLFKAIYLVIFCLIGFSALACAQATESYLLITDFLLDKPIPDDVFFDPNNGWSVYRLPLWSQEGISRSFHLLSDQFYLRVHYVDKRALRLVAVTQDMDIWTIFRYFADPKEKEEIALNQANFLRPDDSYTFVSTRYITLDPVVIPKVCGDDITDESKVGPRCGGECPQCMANFVCTVDSDCGPSLKCSPPLPNPENPDEVEPSLCVPDDSFAITSQLSMVLAALMLAVSLFMLF